MNGLSIRMIILLLIFILKVSAQADNRCYLPSGSSSETFSVSEELPIGSVIGIVNVSGNVQKDGDISLEVKEQDIVKIKPCSKTLILNKKLDKEGTEGKEGIVVEVICTRKDSEDPSITIPIHIIVMDANDNTPEFVNSPYFVKISEATLVGSTVIHTILATDGDQKGPFSTVEYFIEPGPFSHFLKIPNKLDGVITLAEPLDYENDKEFNVTIRAQDEGYSPRSAYTTLTVTVLDADDQNPQFSAERYKARLPEDPQPGSKLLMLPVTLSAIDPDEGIRAIIEYSFLENNGETAYFNINKNTGEITLKQRLPVNFKLPVTLVVRAAQMDNEDRQTLTTVQISDGKTILNEFRFLHTIYDAKVLEHTPTGIVIVTLQTTRSLESENFLKFHIVEKQENFLITNFGEVMIAKPPDYEVKKHFIFHVTVSDGQQNDITTVNITVLDINDHDPKFLQSSYFFEVNNPLIRTGTVLGKIKASDKDIENTIMFSLYGFHASAFSITSFGEIQIVNISVINSTFCYFMAIATDNGLPSRHSAVPVTVQFPEAFIFQNINKKDDSYIIIIAFGILLGILFIIIIILLIYIIKYKNEQENSIKISTEGTNKFVIRPIEETDSDDKLISNPIEANRIQDTNIMPNSLPMNNWETYPNGKRRELNHTSPYKVTMNGFMRNSESALSNYPCIQWPNGSIPQRVKSIGWEGDSSAKIEENETKTGTTLKLEIFEQTSTDES